MSAGGPGARVRLDRVEALFDEWRSLDRVDAPEARAMERALLAAFARDRARYSDILEASFSIDARGEHAYRFSYAFPGWRPTSGPGAIEAVHAALACAAPFGPALVGATRRLLRAATDPVVEQPLIGIAWDRDGAPRHKVYLQFVSGAGGGAVALAERITGVRGLAACLGGGALHMLGIDLGAGGVLGAKLYVAHDRVIAAGDDDGEEEEEEEEEKENEREKSIVGVALGRLVGGGASGAAGQGRAFRNVLAIHRIEGASGAVPPLTDVDIGLAENGLGWGEIAGAPWISERLRESRVARVLLERFRVGVRRVSISAGSQPRLSVYYVLRELEEP